MNLYPWIVLVHVTAVMIFFIAHGAPAMVALRLRHERDPERVLALLDLARWSTGRAAFISLVVGVLAGIVAGFVGNWWGHLWIWLAIAILVGVTFAMGPMTPITSPKLHAMRHAAGIGVEPPFGFGQRGEAPPANAEELQRLLAAWNPVPTTVIGFGGFIAILALMLLKPF